MRCHSPRNSTRAGRRGPWLLRAGPEAGFTLIEVLVSALLVALISAAVADALIAGAYTSADQRNRSVAHELAQQDQERLRGMSAQQLNGLNQTLPQITVNGTVYTVRSQAQFVGSSGGTCSSSAAAYFRTSSTVTWGNPSESVVEESVITPPAGGTLLAQVEDQTTAALSGVTVSASGPDYASGTTDANGCTVLAGLATGSYNVTLAKPGYVDPNGNASPPNLTATVTSTGTTTPSTSLMMGQAGTITASFRDASRGTLSGEADGLSWFGSGASTQMSSYASASSSTAATQLTASNLFPFAFSGPSYTNNYQVWAGRCLQMRPPTGVNQISVPPGSTQSWNIQEPELDVFVYSGSTRIAPAHVKITFQVVSGPACTDSWYSTIASNASTSATGALAYPGVPFASGSSGTLSVCADNGSQKNTATGVTDSFTSATSVSINVTGPGSGSGKC